MSALSPPLGQSDRIVFSAVQALLNRLAGEGTKRNQQQVVAEAMRLTQEAAALKLPLPPALSPSARHPPASLTRAAVAWETHGWGAQPAGVEDGIPVDKIGPIPAMTLEHDPRSSPPTATVSLPVRVPAGTMAAEEAATAVQVDGLPTSRDAAASEPSSSVSEPSSARLYAKVEAPADPGGTAGIAIRAYRICRHLAEPGPAPPSPNMQDAARGSALPLSNMLSTETAAGAALDRSSRVALMTPAGPATIIGAAISGMTIAFSGALHAGDGGVKVNVSSLHIPCLDVPAEADYQGAIFCPCCFKQRSDGYSTDRIKTYIVLPSASRA